ncbi:Fic family protein [Nonomuraea sp. SMC257]|uniref:Fic family protein n=1 Tax=Nonomuraea montanisoli TaxID=2741721 RepID=A0A7Y6IE01_9ACTN|nr:Fic family protein [Nonomuraea montanisoli]NUW35079.1 Fic family protein [Nonomuraea montanisoli]
MAHYLEASWPVAWEAPSKRDRRGGAYRPYLPDPLTGHALTVAPDVAEQAAQAETLVRRLVAHPVGHGVDGLARFLLRSEAIASSRIEGLQASPQQVALAELAAREAGVSHGFTATAALVANNVTALRRAVTDLVAAEAVTLADVIGLHKALLPDERYHGLREVQNWVGGGHWHPLDAEFVPPPPAHVRPLMDDLVTYMNGAQHAPLLQAALVHAQFETIPPFTDGNGRVGRALIHTVLTRRGLTPSAILPISLVLLTRCDAYVAGLTTFRHAGDAGSPEAESGVNDWLRVFFAASITAVEQAERFADELKELHGEWLERHRAFREGEGLRAVPRTGSAVARLLDLLPAVPLVTARTVQSLLDVTHPAARQALEELAGARILFPKQVERNTTGYLAREIFDLLTLTERRLASTRWDTRETPPRRVVPARPQR